jgi:hypothetical protein
MGQTRQKKISLEAQLGHLAMQFRSAGSDAERTAVAGCYEHAVKQLIRCGEWKEMPPFEDMLPDEWLPEAFFEYWSIPSPHDHEPVERARTFSVDYPLFILMDGEAPLIGWDKEGRVRIQSVAVFTDRKKAEHYRKETAPKCETALIEDERAFANVLTNIRDLVGLVTFDSIPGVKGKKIIPLDEILRQFSEKPDSQRDGRHR